MRAREIHAAAERLAGKPLLWTSVKSTVAAGASSGRPRFRRVRHGVYERAKRPGADQGLQQTQGSSSTRGHQM